MRMYLNAHPDILRKRARELVSRILCENEKDVAQAKLGDIRLTLEVARSGKDSVVPVSWDDDQKELWDVLADYHNISVLNI